MLTEVKFAFKITRQMVIYNRLKNFRKMFKKRYRSIILYADLIIFLLTDTITDCFHCVGKYCCDSLGLKMYLCKGTELVEHPLIIKPVTSLRQIMFGLSLFKLFECLIHQ